MAPGTLPFFSAVGVAASLVMPAAELATILSLSIPVHLVFIATTNFLEGLERPMPGAVAMWITIVVNLVLNLLLVPRFGAEGSAWTTLASRTFLATILVVFVLQSVELRPVLSAGLSRISYRQLSAIGFAAMLSSTVEAGAFSAMGLIAARISADALATVNLATGGLLSLLAMISLGLGSAAAVLVSKALGAGDVAGARRAGAVAVSLNFVIFVVLGGTCTLLAAPIAGLFTSSPSIVRLVPCSGIDCMSLRIQ